MEETVPEKPKRSRSALTANLLTPAPHPGTLMARIRFLAEHTDRIIFGDHTQDRMEERGIHSEDVYRVLRLGEIVGRVVAGIDAGEWKCKVVAKLRGSRQLGVVTIILMNDKLFIKTTEWEDR
jgi:Domain of unknown function (DUF4258)